MIVDIEGPVKQSWTTILEALQIGDIRSFPIAKKSTVTTRISKEIKLMYPARIYSVDAKTVKGRVLVQRVA